MNIEDREYLFDQAQKLSEILNEECVELMGMLEKIEDRVAEIVFEDSGIQYDPLANEEPDVTLSAEEREIGGLGIFITKKTMDDVKYEYKNGRNILTLLKKI